MWVCLLQIDGDDCGGYGGSRQFSVSLSRNYKIGGFWVKLNGDLDLEDDLKGLIVD